MNKRNTYESKIEYIKNIIDLYKVLITLAVGVLVLAPTLLANVFENPQHTGCLIAAMIGLLITAFLSFLVIFGLVDLMQYQDNDKHWTSSLDSPLLFLGMFSSPSILLLSFCSIAFFSILNIGSVNNSDTPPVCEMHSTIVDIKSTEKPSLSSSSPSETQAPSTEKP